MVGDDAAGERAEEDAQRARRCRDAEDPAALLARLEPAEPGVRGGNNSAQEQTDPRAQNDEQPNRMREGLGQREERRAQDREQHDFAAADAIAAPAEDRR